MAKVKTEVVKLGGFWILFMEGNKGDTFVFGPSAPVTRAKVAHREICVSGSKKVVRAPQGAPEFPIVHAGENSDVRPDLFAGTYVFECLEDNTKDISICGVDVPSFNYKWLDIAAGEEFVIPQGRVAGLGGKFSVDNGEVHENLTRLLALSRDVKITAITRVLGVMAWGG